MSIGRNLGYLVALERRFSNRYLPMSVNLCLRYFKDLWLHGRGKVQHLGITVPVL